MTYAASTRRRVDTTTDQLTRALGWFSIGLGTVELLAPKVLTDKLGMSGSEPLVRAYGVRELAAGIGILTARNRAPWVWSRLMGDALDLATLTSRAARRQPQHDGLAIATAAVAGVAALDMICAQRLAAAERRPLRPARRRDYSGRSGFCRSIAEVRGSASDFQTPRDLRIPDLLRPYTSEAPRLPAIIEASAARA